MITILMPLANVHPPYLADALQSVHDQTQADWRLLIVIDAENRQRFEELLAPHLRDPRTQCIENENGRLAGSINTGMRAATSDFVALLFGDDRWAPNAVETLDRYIVDFPSVDFFHSSRTIIDDDGVLISSVHHAPAMVDAVDFRKGSPVKHLLCWRVATGLAVGGIDENIGETGPDDWDFPWTMAEHGAEFMAIDEPLYIYRDHRTGPRLTLDVTRQQHAENIRGMLRKHGVPEREIARTVARARSGYLRQSRYRSSLDRRLRGWLRLPPRLWRDSYK